MAHLSSITITIVFNKTLREGGCVNILLLVRCPGFDSCDCFLPSFLSLQCRHITSGEKAIAWLPGGNDDLKSIVFEIQKGVGDSWQRSHLSYTSLFSLLSIFFQQLSVAINSVHPYSEYLTYFKSKRLFGFDYTRNRVFN